MGVLDNATAHFDKLQVKNIEVPEWDTTLYSKNLSLADKSKWMKRADGDNWSYMVYAVILGTTDAEGEPVFDIGDKSALMNNVDPDLVSRIATFVLDIGEETEEEREKN